MELRLATGAQALHDLLDQRRQPHRHSKLANTPAASRKAWRPIRYLFDDDVWDDRRAGITSNTRRIRKRCIKLLVSRTIRDTPRADALKQFLNRENRANVDVAPLLVATRTLCICGLDAARCDWVWVILERW
jgi:hypothetical protein